MRGNRDNARPRNFRTRSIPACAGEPRISSMAARPTMVYPRVCGGTIEMIGYLAAQGGLSPRVRGNLGCPASGIAGARSIPACAGEPPYSTRPGHRSPVYPRVCGGTDEYDYGSAEAQGLSPRVRGNRAAEAPTPTRARSIPACAGEPYAVQRKASVATVYPRVCGGTPGPQRVLPMRRGLSPRVRGNRQAAYPPVSATGSIPACAGEP